MIQVVAQNESKLFVEVVTGFGVIVDINTQTISALMPKMQAAKVGGWDDPKEGANFIVPVVEAALVEAIDTGEGILANAPASWMDGLEAEYNELFTELTSDLRVNSSIVDVVPVIDTDDLDKSDSGVSFTSVFKAVKAGAVTITKYNPYHDGHGRFTSSRGGSASTAGMTAASQAGKGKWRGSDEIQLEIDKADGMISQLHTKALKAAMKGDTAGYVRYSEREAKWQAHKKKQEGLKQKALQREEKTGIKPAEKKKPGADELFDLPEVKIGDGPDAEMPKEFTDHKSAASFMRKSLSTPGHKIYVKVDKDADLGAVHDTTHQLLRLKKAYPVMFEEGITEVNFRYFGAKQSGTYAHAKYDYGGRTSLEFNAGFNPKGYGSGHYTKDYSGQYGSLGRVGTMYARDVKSGYHPPLGRLKATHAVVTHEFGHAIDWRLQGKGVTKPAGKVTVKDSAKVSKYAKTNGGESFAESFTALVCGTAGGLGIAPVVTQSMIVGARSNGIL